MRTDNGGEYLSTEFQNYLKEKGIRHELTVPHSPEQNGVAERMNRTLVESARSMIAHAGLSNIFWAEAISTGLHLKKVLKKFGQTQAKPVSTPADLNVKLQKEDGVSRPVDAILYQSIVGSLLYAAIATRPDIAQAVGVVSKFCANPSQSHLTAAKRILRYLKETACLGLSYKKCAYGSLTGYSDADWAGDMDDRHSTSENVFLLAGGAVSWLSKKQATVALSTAEAEYVALSAATQEAIWLPRLLADVGVPPKGPTVIHEDNQGAISMAKNAVGHARTKHIDIRYLFVREGVQNGAIALKYVATDEMIADILTKPLPKHRFEKLVTKLSMRTVK